MEKNNNKGVVALLIVIIAILVALCILFATDTISFNSNTTNDNKQISENKEINDNNVTNSSTNTQNEEITYFYNVSDLNVKALNNYSIFSDITNNSNVVESIQEGTKYYADLYLTGQVNIRTYKNDKWIKGNLNITNVIDIIEFSVPAEESEQLLYLLTDKGDVYSYKFGEVDNNNFNANKVENVSNVKKLFISHFSKENAGGSWALFAITNNNDCIMINGESV